MTQKKIFIIDTISTFHMRYAIEAEIVEHAYDEIVMKDSGNEDDLFDEISQRHLGEQIIEGREISRESLDKLVRESSNDKNVLSVNPDFLEKFIRKIDYERN